MPIGWRLPSDLIFPRGNPYSRVLASYPLPPPPRLLLPPPFLPIFSVFPPSFLLCFQFVIKSIHTNRLFDFFLSLCVSLFFCFSLFLFSVSFYYYYHMGVGMAACVCISKRQLAYDWIIQALSSDGFGYRYVSIYT